MAGVSRALRCNYGPTARYLGHVSRLNEGPKKPSPYELHYRGSLTHRCQGFELSLPREDVYKKSRPKKWSFVSVTIHLLDSTQHKFNSLCKRWRDETLYYSSLEQICFHPAYQTIMAMGEKALPFIMKDLDKQFGHWFYALNQIVQKNVAEGAGNLEEARQRWLNWGREQRLI